MASFLNRPKATSENPVSCVGFAEKSAESSRFSRSGICEQLVFEGCPKEELAAILETCRHKYEDFKAKKLALDMSRGKPGAEQLDLSDGLLNILGTNDYTTDGGIDCRNYGGLDGIPELKRLFADIFGVRQEEVLAGGNSSLSLMHESVRIFALGASGAATATGARKFLCPSPGYDRHFTICERLGIEMQTVPMTEHGPDMAIVREQVKDPAVVGIWCVPVFSNPQGYVYSAETVRDFAALLPTAPNFRIYWDNAYAVHPIVGETPQIPNLLRLCEQAGKPDLPLMFTSFSKISFPGAAVSAVAASAENLAALRKSLFAQTIGPDKLNQLRHVRFFKNLAGVEAHMQKHAKILAPKFETVKRHLRTELTDIASWHEPQGGYFISLDTLPGCAKRVVALCADAGLTLTPAGATYPYGSDPVDQNIRIAPTFPPVEQLEAAMELFCLAVKIASLEKVVSQCK